MEAEIFLKKNIIKNRVLEGSLYRCPDCFKVALYKKYGTRLWDGDVENVIALFEGCKLKRAMNFVDYLRKHSPRIPEYSYW